jgi:ribosomal protein S9
MEPIIATEKYNVVDINIKAWGGGYSGQAQAIRQALGRALINDDPENRYFSLIN